MPDDTLHATAVFMKKTDKTGKLLPAGRRPTIRVHFNPETLDISYRSALQKGHKKQPAQVVSETTAKLTMDLVFDTTMPGTDGAHGQTRAGKDVRSETIKIAQLMDPSQQSPRKKNAKTGELPSIVIFHWGAIRFEGYLDSVREKIELFSPEGIPLRATVSIAMTQQQRSLDPEDAAVTPSVSARGDVLGVAALPVTPLSPGRSLVEVVLSMGDPGSTRDLAERNGIENLRFPEVNELVVFDSQQRPSPDLSSPGHAIVHGAANLASGSTAAQFDQLRGDTVSGTPRARLSPNLEIGASSNAVGIGANASFGVFGELDIDAQVSLSANVGEDADIELGTDCRE